MTHEEFLLKYTNKPVDFDGAYGNQCMDLMHQYVYDVRGLTDKKLLAAAGAAQVYSGFKIEWGKFFKKIDNTPAGIPEKGDIMFWGTKVGPYGHVAIFCEADKDAPTRKFVSFDQNWPTNSLPHLQEHDYTGVVGWLRFITQDAPIDECAQKITILTNRINNELIPEIENLKNKKYKVGESVNLVFDALINKRW